MKDSIKENEEERDLPKYFATAVIKEEETGAKQKLSDLEYSDGKERDEVDFIEEQEIIYGTDKISPFKTADIRVFRRRIELMSRDQMSAMAEKVAARIYSSEYDQKSELMRAFYSWASTNGHSQTNNSKKSENGALSGAFEQSKSVNKLQDKLKSKTLSELQSTAARLGFNPSFDRERLIKAITQEYQRQS
tara:strand:+ start:381 stop:953 length:573 start_codon:yes stop_codon:yes gene_type:complete